MNPEPRYTARPAAILIELDPLERLQLLLLDLPAAGEPVLVDDGQEEVGLAQAVGESAVG